MSTVGPVVLGPNQPPRFYRGGARIAAFRDAAPPAGPGADGSGDVDWQPEDWVGSATTLFGATSDGLTRLAGGTPLRDAIAADPLGYLGPEHAERYGASPALLVKLLDAGQRLPVHCHPADGFAREHLASAWGKTEAWIIVAAEPGSAVHLGFREDVSEDTLARWVADQDPAMLSVLNQVPVRAGDAILVPAGLPHAIGQGVFLVELQQPTDLSVLLEWGPFRIDGPAEGHLGLGYDLALSCVNRAAWDTGQLDGLRGSAAHGAVSAVFPAASQPYFTAQRIRPGSGAVTLDPGFSILIVLDGSGLLCPAEGGDLPLRRGMTVLLPFGAGRTRLQGDCELIRCLPPNGSEARAVPAPAA